MYNCMACIMFHGRRGEEECGKNRATSPSFEVVFDNCVCIGRSRAQMQLHTLVLYNVYY